MISMTIAGNTLATTLVHLIAEKWDNLGSGKFISNRDGFEDAALRYLDSIKEEIGDKDAALHIANGFKHQRINELARGHQVLEEVKNRGFITQYGLAEAMQDVCRFNSKQAS